MEGDDDLLGWEEESWSWGRWACLPLFPRRRRGRGNALPAQEEGEEADFPHRDLPSWRAPPVRQGHSCLQC